MLVLTRRAGESIVIGDEVRVVVLDVRGETVRLGIEAPAAVPIYRHEIWAAVKQENQAAAQANITRLPSTPPKHTAKEA